jgi:formamidopyrimidine-DNA glycosylase
MPELPEVEVTRVSLGARLLDATVREVWVGKALRQPLGCTPASLAGLRAGPMARRGKYLWLPLADVSRDGGLLMHLGMSGSLSLADAPPPRGPHDHFEMLTDRGTLRLTDPRRFGAVVWSEAIDLDPAAKLLAGLGMEPFDPELTPATLRAGLQSRRAPIKALLLSGELVVGAGNIYASELLHRAGIDPRTPGRRIGRERCERLLQSLRFVLGRAIALGGSTLRDYRDGHGGRGAYQDQAEVYGREGQACRRCGATIRRIVQAQRATYFCPHCQHR